MGLLSNRTVRSSLKPGDSDGDYGLRFNTPLPLSLSRPPIRTNGARNGAQPETDASRKRKLTVLPLEVGTSVNCRWRDGKYHPVKVIERRKLSCDGVKDYEYYVHYTECD